MRATITRVQYARSVIELITDQRQFKFNHGSGSSLSAESTFIHAKTQRKLWCSINYGNFIRLIKESASISKDKYKIKIREKAIERVKEKIIKHNKTVDDYSDAEMKELIAAEEGNLNEDVKKGILTTLLVAAGIEIISGR